MKYKKLYDLDMEKIIDDFLYLDKNIYEIAEEIGCSHMTIFRALKGSNNQEVLNKLGKRYSKKKKQQVLNETIKIGNIKITRKQLLEWKNDDKIICVLQCLKCKKLNIIKERFYTYNCKCGKNLIIYQNINYAGSKVVFKNKEMKDKDSLKIYW